MILNENNIQAPFQYKISENSFELLERSGEIELNTNDVQVKVFQGQRLFCADIGYAVDGPLEDMEFLIDDIKVYPVLLEELEDLQTVDVKENEIYLIEEDINFKSIIFFPPADLNKKFKYKITTYSSTFSSFMFDEIAKKLNSLDTNYPIKNYYENIDYKVNDIIKYKGYLYRVFKEFTSDRTDYYLKANCNLITPFRKLELNTEYKANELVEYNNNFLIFQKNILYENIADLNGLLKPLQDIIFWFDGIIKIYKNQIIIKDNISYIVLEDIDNPIWNDIQNKLNRLIKAENTFYDDSNSAFGNNTNTVQKAIEKLKSDKQDSLIPGNNIVLNGGTISVNGGTNKEYIVSDVYFVNDLIVRDSKIYKVNEDFIAADWSTDRAKLTLISSGGGGADEAADVSFDNLKANLEYISGYDFPKFKTPIADTINLVLTNNEQGTEDHPVTIIKESDGSYVLKGELNNFNAVGASDYLYLYVKSIDGRSNIYQKYSILSQFFEITGLNDDEIIYTNNNEISITDTKADEFFFTLASDLLYINLSNKEGKFLDKSYNITLNIKNRVLRNQDRYLFTSLNSVKVTTLELKQYGNSVKIIGEIITPASGINIASTGGLFYSPIIENYFNLSDNKETSGIISGSGKPVKFIIEKTNYDTDIYYLIAISYKDGSYIPVGETFTFNLTPDKNSALDPVYSKVDNVQQMGEALNEKIDKESEIIKNKFSDFNIIADGKEHFSGKYYENADGGRKPIYYRTIMGSYGHGSTFNSNNEWEIDKWLTDFDCGNYNGLLKTLYFSANPVHATRTVMQFSMNKSTKEFYILYDQWGDKHNLKMEYYKLEYTKNIDSYEY